MSISSDFLLVFAYIVLPLHVCILPVYCGVFVCITDLFSYRAYSVIVTYISK